MIAGVSFPSDEPSMAFASFVPPARQKQHRTGGLFLVKSSRTPRLQSGTTYLVRRGGRIHVGAEDYGYKTNSYYTILARELAGEPVDPDSRSVLDAAVVPVCLEVAARAGIPVADCIISQSCTARLPAVLYGLNYFSCPSEFTVVRSPDTEKEVIRHITNNGKYPFCYQPLDDDAEIVTAAAIFGKTVERGPKIEDVAQKLYTAFRIPLTTMVFIRDSREALLSSLTPTRYSSLSADEKSLLMAYLTSQEFL
jgi:hypothetical protein